MKKIVLGIGMAAVICFTAQSGEYWITPTGVDGAGDGSVANPWVRTTAASFDALMNGGTIPNDSVIHLLAGTFKTITGFPVKPGWKVRGAGMDATVVQLQPVTSVITGGRIIGGNLWYYTYGGHNREVSDLTVDCNLAAQTLPLGYGAVGLSGHNARISRVKVINWGSTDPGVECFVLCIGSHPLNAQMITNVVIEGCVLERPALVDHQQGVTGILIGGGANDPGPFVETPGESWIIGAEVRDCLIKGVSPGVVPDLGRPHYFGGIMAWFVSGMKISNNKFFDVGGECVSSGCGSLLNLTVENNMFMDVMYAITFRSTDYCGPGASMRYAKENFAFRNNIIALKNGGVGIGAAAFCTDNNDPMGNPSCYGIDPIRVKNVLVSGNTIRAAGTGPITSGLGVFARVDNITLENNTVDSNGGLELNYQNNNTFAVIENNRTSSGREISAGPGAVLDINDQEVVFTPSQAGWYRLTQYSSSWSSSHVKITRDFDAADNTLTDIEFDYSVNSYTTDLNFLGQINMTRGFPYGSQLAVNAIRIGNFFPTTDEVSLDIFVASAPPNRPIKIKVSGGKNHQFAQVPVYLGNPGTPPPVSKTLSLGKGFRTSSEIFSAGTATIQGTITAGSASTQITDSTGKLIPAALAGTVAPANGGLGVDASTFPADRIPYTSSAGAFGQATLTAYGRDLIDSPDYLAARSSLQLVPGTHVQPYSSRLADISALFPDSGSILVGNGTTWAKLGFDSTLGKVLVSNGSTVQWGNALWETSESSSTPVTDTASTAVGSTSLRLFDFVTLPTTEKLYVITGIEWKNGTTVAGNTVCGAVLANANPPTVAAVPTIAYGLLTANSGASSIQRVSQIVSQPIRGGTILGVFIQADNSTHTYRTATVASANNRKSTVTFPANGNVANQENAAWVANTTKAYIKVYYRGYR